MIVIKKPVRFLWDNGNKDKNWEKHRVANEECEEIFFDNNKKIFKDKKHSFKEKRHIILGETKKRRLLYTVFTLRGEKIRVISSRDINKKEEKLYEKNT